MSKVLRNKNRSQNTFWGNIWRDKKLNIAQFGIKTHCILGLIIRIICIIWGEIQDKWFLVQYTDIDYHVFTDGARYVLEGGSPYDRHTYRYSPLLAYLLLPNVFLHHTWGKLLFSLADIAAAIIIFSMVSCNFSRSQALVCAMMWLYNPVAIIIATRGNADSISAILVLFSLALLQKQKYIPLVGVIHGISIHLRLYPLIFSLPMYLSLQTRNPIRKVTRFKSAFHITKIPNLNQLILIISCILTLSVLTFSGYWLYGFPFLNESLIYHVTRRDIRHNYSVYFYVLYLSAGFPVDFSQRAVVFAPQILILIILSITYGTRRHLQFCLLCQAIVLVTYNPVMTTQYFVWFMSLIPPCIPHINISVPQVVGYSTLWVFAQLLWLLPAYLLEFEGRDTFIYIWMCGVVFFSVNILILAKLIRAYNTLENKKTK